MIECGYTCVCVCINMRDPNNRRDPRNFWKEVDAVVRVCVWWKFSKGGIKPGDFATSFSGELSKLGKSKVDMGYNALVPCVWLTIATLRSVPGVLWKERAIFLCEQLSKGATGWNALVLGTSRPFHGVFLLKEGMGTYCNVLILKSLAMWWAKAFLSFLGMG